MTGQLYNQFSLTIAIAVFSGINALTLSPALCGILRLPGVKNVFFRGFNQAEALAPGYAKAVQVMGLAAGLRRRSRALRAGLRGLHGGADRFRAGRTRAMSR